MLSSNPPEGLAAVLELCRDIEVECGRLYSLYALGHRAADPKIHELWIKTAKEEAGHADQIRLALRLDGSVNGTTVAIDEARAMLAHMKQLVADTRRKIPSVPEALQTAIELEKKLSAFHLAQAATFPSGAQRSLFEAMMRADDGHLARLEEAYAPYAKPLPRRPTTPPGKP
jgi:rubrerythrin